MNLLLSLLVGVALTTASAFAFSKHGHMASGSLAYQSMKPADAAAIGAVLEHHPFVKGPWAEALTKKEPRNVSREERLFMLAAAWPDEVRSAKWKKKYHHRDWHFVNYELTEGATRPGAVLGGDLLQTLPNNLKTASQKSAPLEERAIAICWLIHQVGDLHQPLHVVALVNETFPKGDRGGNLFFVRTKAGNKPVYLHGVWDGMGVKKYTDFAGVQDNAIKLKNAQRAASLPDLRVRKADEFKRIAEEEIFPIAAEFAYLGGKLEGADEHEAEDSADHEYVLPAGYLKVGGGIAEKQLALAGYRIGALLTTVAR